MSGAGSSKSLRDDEIENLLLNSLPNSDDELELDEPLLVSDVENIDANLLEDDEESVSTSEPAPRQLRIGRPSVLLPWSSQVYTPTIHSFDNSNSGLKTNLSERSLEGEIYEHFFDEILVEKICFATNKYAERVLNSSASTSRSHTVQWKSVTAAEMYCFFALTMLMTRKKALQIQEYWSTHTLLHQPIFNQVMSRDRYRQILAFLHYNDYELEASNDKLTKLRPLLEHVINIFKTSYVPYEKLCIDESLILFKGRLMFKQYIPSKRSRFGVKFFVLCDTKTDYIIDFIIYVGTNSDIQDEFNLGQSGAVVTTLLKDYFNKGHILYVDNWYTSPSLFSVLHTFKTNACGTARKSRVGYPSFGKVNKNEIEFKYTTHMMAFKWHDRRDVHFLSTFHSNTMKDTENIDYKTNTPIIKPEAIIDYNHNMGSVDKTDMLLSSLSCLRKTKKWYKKIAFHIFDLILLNSHSSFKLLKNKELCPLADFQFSLIEQLILKHRGPDIPRRQVGSQVDSLLRLNGKHFPCPVPSTATRAKAYRRCHVCLTSKRKERKRVMTNFMCTQCNVSLCVHPCFEQYHTLLHY